MKKLISTNPAKNYEIIGEVDISTDEEIREKVELANKAKLAWKELGIKGRVELLKPICEEFKRRKEQLQLLETKEMGKPTAEANLDGFLEEFEWFLDNGEKSLFDEITHEDEKSIHKIVYEPYGVAAVITPWNFPTGMFIWGTIPNLVAGNTVVFKISEECPLIGKLIEEIMNSKNLPKGVFSEVYGDGSVGQKLAESDVNLIWFIKVVLEMGGSSPAVLFEDIDVRDVIPEIYVERFRNCGQVCDAIKRLIVHESIFDKVVDSFKQEISKKIVGDPSSDKTQISSLVAKRQLDLLEDQVKDAIKKGARVIIGGKRPENLSGAFYEPTILTNIKKDMRVWNEEVFGPVLPVVSFKTEEEAINLANDTSYGLGSRVYSKDLDRAKRVASRIKAGTVEINHVSRWLSCNPFGGFKDSGMGREHGIPGFRELCQIKVISMGK